MNSEAPKVENLRERQEYRIQRTSYKCMEAEADLRVALDALTRLYEVAKAGSACSGCRGKKAVTLGPEGEEAVAFHQWGGGNLIVCKEPKLARALSSVAPLLGRKP